MLVCEAHEHRLKTGEEARLSVSCAQVCKAPRRKPAVRKLQHGALDSGKQGGGPQAHGDTCSFEFAPVVAGPGAPEAGTLPALGAVFPTGSTHA